MFYGWAIVAASGLVVFSSGPGQSYVFSIFIDSIIADTGLSRPGISALYMASTGVSAVLVAIVSRLAERYGPRAMLVAIGLGFGGACFGMATATNIVLFYIAFASLRALGQGSLTINAVLLVNQWFVSRRGKAIAMMGLGAVLSNGAFPPVAIRSRAQLIDTTCLAAAFTGGFITLNACINTMHVRYDCAMEAGRLLPASVGPCPLRSPPPTLHPQCTSAS